MNKEFIAQGCPVAPLSYFLIRAALHVSERPKHHELLPNRTDDCCP